MARGGGTVGQLYIITFQAKIANLGPKALKKEFSTPKRQEETSFDPIVFTSAMDWKLNYTLFDPNMSSICILEAKIISRPGRSQGLLYKHLD